MDLRLIVANLSAHWVRSLLTLLSVTLAVFLICILQSVVTALSATVESASRTRLWVQSAVSLYVDLPLSYESKIRTVPGIESICKWQWFGGLYQDRSNFFAQFGVDAETFGPTYPELEVVEGSYDEFARQRNACLIGRGLADTYGFRVGESVPILGTIFERADGEAWQFEVAGIYRSRDTSLDEETLFFHFDYLREAVEAGEVRNAPQGTGIYMLALPPGQDPTPVMAAVDALFENGPQRVQTTTEAEFNRQFISMLGNVPLLLRAIGGAVLFAIFFAILNTMLMAARERTRDIGILKALGFTNRWVFVGLTAESLLLATVGGALGILLALAVSDGIGKFLAGTITNFRIQPDTILLAVAVTVGLGLSAGIVPAFLASRQRPVEALRAE